MEPNLNGGWFYIQGGGGRGREKVILHSLVEVFCGGKEMWGSFVCIQVLGARRGVPFAKRGGRGEWGSHHKILQYTLWISIMGTVETITSLDTEKAS